jgi:hypothetical protein
MKNIHILPTDKPSRLYKIRLTQNLQLLEKKYLKSSDSLVITQNIYITSDKEIKDERLRWIIDNREGMNGFIHQVSVILDSKICPEIILTTDQDLILDGVQAIDDEFLEWFVKNPSCEFVEVDSWSDDLDGIWLKKYKTIIPEIDTCTFCDGTGQVVSSTTISRFKTCDCKMIPQKELKQENDYTALLKPVGTKQDSLIEKMKPLQEQWQKDMDKSLQQQDKNKYNEEDMEKAFRVGFNVGYNDEESPSYLTFEEWIKEYKKK